MHDRVELLVKQIDRTYSGDSDRWFAPLERAVAGVAAAEAAWHPAADVHTIRQLVEHMTFWAAFTLGRLEGEAPTGRKIDNEATFGPAGDPGDVGGWARALEEMRSTYRRFAAAVARERDADLERPLNSAGTPAWRMVSGLIAHDAYHIGQIVLLRKLRGSWPA